MRRVALDLSHLAEVTTEAGSLLSIMELARPLPALWTPWGRFVVANAEFGLRRLRQDSDARLLDTLRELDAAADDLISKALEWALLENHPLPIAVEVAQAFIEWESARRVAYGLRRSASGRTVEHNAGGTPAGGSPELAEWLSRWESESATLLVRAVCALEGRSEGPGAYATGSSSMD